MSIEARQPHRPFWRRLLLHRAVIIFLLICAIYGLRAGRLLRYPSITPYFVNLAESLTHGRVSISDPAAFGYDLIRFDDQWFVAQQPLPALLLMPVVGLIGADHVSDVAVAVAMGALSAALADFVIGMTAPGLDTRRRGLLLLALALGTVHFSLSVMGTVWFLGQITTIVFVWLLIWAVYRGRPLAAGIAAGLICLGRPSILPGALLFAAGMWLMRAADGRPALNRRVKYWALFIVPVAAGILWLGWYNWARFGDPLDMGYSYIQEAPDIKQRLLEHGNFSLAFLPENLVTATIKPPIAQFDCAGQPCLNIQPDPLGMGLIWTSPVLLYALLALFKPGPLRRENILLAGVVVLVLGPSLLYHNPGSVQFGYRFLLDALPFWIILVARGVEHERLSRLTVVTAYCVAINLWGTNWLINLVYFTK